MQIDLGSNARERLAQLLRDAEAAHAEYEKSLGHADADWPKWYAWFILERVAV